ncbi:MAG: serine protease, partial [Anaerolineae bacterium]
ANQHGGDVSKMDEIPPPTADEPRYERVHRVLRRYDEHLTDTERDFLTLFSAFRTPVHVSAFDKVFGVEVKAEVEAEEKPGLLKRLFGRGLTSPPLGGIEGGLVQRLLTYRILRHNPHDDTYTTHPLIRNHYFARLTAGDPSTSSGQARQTAQDAHERIKDYYLELAGDTPRFPTLDDLAPLIEVVHHACRAGAYDEAYQVLQERIYQEWPRRVLVNQLGAWETALALMQEFFPDGDISSENEPQVSDLGAKSWILNEVGLCLMNLGRLGEAVTFYERAVAGYLDMENLDMENWSAASIIYRNLAGLHAYLGALAASADAARQALALARRAENKQDEVDSMGYQAWAVHLLGDLKTAERVYLQAEALQREINPSLRYHYSVDGIKHADHLWRAPVEEGGDPAYARRVTEANLEICQRNRVVQQISQCYRVLGDLDAGAGNHENARAHYDQALKIARAITHRPSLIEALLARGRWAARRAYQSQTSEVWKTSKVSAFSGLNEALGYAVEGGYRVYEADIRVALAWAHLAAGEPERARQEALRRAQDEAERAQQMSVEMGYHWGQVDAAEVLAALEQCAANAHGHLGVLHNDD